MVLCNGCLSAQLSALSLLEVSFTGVMLAFSLGFKLPPGTLLAAWTLPAVSTWQILSSVCELQQ